MGVSCKISLKPIHWFYPLVSHFFKWIQTVFKKCQGLNTCPLYIFVSFLNMKVIAIARVIKLLSLSWSLKPYYPMVLQGGASELANLVNITPMSLGFMEDIYIYTGWWFGTFLLCPYTGKFVTPTDELIYFFRGLGQPSTSTTIVTMIYKQTHTTGGKRW